MEDLIGFEGTILELEAELLERGYQEILFYQDLGEILENEYIVVDHESEDKEIQISFEISSGYTDVKDILDTQIVIISVVESGNNEEENEEDEL